jgi:hypothetical protein
MKRYLKNMLLPALILSTGCRTDEQKAICKLTDTVREAHASCTTPWERSEGYDFAQIERRDTDSYVVADVSGKDGFYSGFIEARKDHIGPQDLNCLIKLDWQTERPEGHIMGYDQSAEVKIDCYAHDGNDLKVQTEIDLPSETGPITSKIIRQLHDVEGAEKSKIELAQLVGASLDALQCGAYQIEWDQ